jgi:hypothetical protein
VIPDLFQGYNMPEMSRHRKRAHTNLSCDQLISYTAALYDALLLSWMSTSRWRPIHDATETLAKSLDMYVIYLKEQAKNVREHHDQLSIAHCTSVTLLPPNSTPHHFLEKINVEICNK